MHDPFGQAWWYGGSSGCCAWPSRRARPNGDADAASEAPRAAETSGETQPRPDFLFGRPGHSLAIRGEWYQARAESDIYTFVSEQLTLDAGDFNAPGFALDVGFALGSRLDALVGFDYTRAFASSEYRDFIDSDDLPIEQDTTLRQVDLTGSVEFAITPRGRAIGQYTWIPSAVVPYVGGGGGFLWYKLEQVGDFVDIIDLSIFAARFESSGWTPSAHVFGGVDIKLAPQVFLTTQARYVWADAALKRDFSGFDPIDLTGLRIAAGVQFVF